MGVTQAFRFLFLKTIPPAHHSSVFTFTYFLWKQLQIFDASAAGREESGDMCTSSYAIVEIIFLGINRTTRQTPPPSPTVITSTIYCRLIVTNAAELLLSNFFFWLGGETQPIPMALVKIFLFFLSQLHQGVFST